jgi:hypothetical protein
MAVDRELVEFVRDHLCEHHPEAVASLKEAVIERRAAFGIGRAEAHGFNSDASIAGFVALMFLVAPDFDTHPPIAAVLADTSLAPEARLRALFERTAEEDWDAAASASTLRWP